MTEEQCDYVFKFIIIGNGNCGKTSLLYHYTHGKSITNVKQTLGVEFSAKIIQVKQKKIKMQLWDTAGQERYRSLTKGYYRGALGSLIVFDVTNSDSFEALKEWIKCARDFSKPSIQIIIIGNKIDLEKERVISEQCAKQFCQENDVLYIETSANTGYQVNEAFTQITIKLLDLLQQGVIDGGMIKPKFLTTKQPDEKEKQQQCNC
ncbi:unnamed protein product (macronuclear) [Paramecium tetraurelia]|uniref:Chromosome undetermined scaffold_65, whole genome shotgun sequence n=1 Tax=Paramecium tetraurelia TaxID=5888 RepID=Q3SCZ0_PARTE|nr:uncharacterized protein GSPATT00020483001 [Paramecium tetraurelia]CAI44575.1 rab_A16 [Paramecium tetraurelia]CAK86821.1 unnamed protein product [Paramecium tetraurelia]|eukprot:XP_001454218.1 hypothetical protein (macronuclear) [Paramecium tetraurelia strain d4-2]